MKEERREVPIDAAMPGMRLADAVCDAHGTVLLPAGATLSETALAGLRRREVAVLAVWMARQLSPEVAAAQRARREQRLQHVFRRAGEGEAVQVLRQAIHRYREEQA